MICCASSGFEAPSGPAPASLAALKPPPSMADLNADPNAHNRRSLAKFFGRLGRSRVGKGAISYRCFDGHHNLSLVESLPSGSSKSSNKL